jgi:glucokinase
MSRYIGIDIGGTNIKVAAVSARGRVLARGVIDTEAPRGAARAFRRIHDAARQLAGGAGVDAVGIGCAGLIDTRRGALHASPNLKAWEGAPIARIARRYFGVPVIVDNDATSAAFGESFVRGPRGRDLVLIAMGTGVGGGIVADGAVVRGASGFGAEIGHITVDAAGPPCRCGKRGCLEAFAGAYGIVRTARGLMRGRRRGLLAGGEFGAWRVFAAARRGDAVARETARITGEHLGVAIAIILNTLNPSAVVLGGGVAGGWDVLEPHTRRAVARHAFRETIAAARIEKARLGNDAAVVGAAMLARERAAAGRGRR